MSAPSWAGCGASLPQRLVVERPVGSFAFRRYQKVIDVEFPIEGRDAVGHTASYVLRSARGTGTTAQEDVHWATAFVTAYSKADGLAAELRELLEDLGSYDLAPKELDGDWVLWLDGREPGDDWALWTSGSHVVKLGVSPGLDLPEDLISVYTNLYPSDLDEHGHAREGTASSGPSTRQREEQGNMELPRHLREGAPR